MWNQGKCGYFGVILRKKKWEKHPCLNSRGLSKFASFNFCLGIIAFLFK